MKKYIFLFMLFIGCLFVNFNKETVLISAAVEEDTSVMTITPDDFDRRKITINVSPKNYTLIRKAIIYELRFCSDEEVCENKKFSHQNGSYRKVEILASKTYEFETNNDYMDFEYVISSPKDGTKNIYLEFFNATDNAFGKDYLYQYELSTIAQRTIINPDINGDPSHIYDNIQYTSVRKVKAKFNLYQEEVENHTGIVNVCELNKTDTDYKKIICSEYLMENNEFEYYINSYGDGYKYLGIFLEKKGNTLDIENHLYNDVESGSATLTYSAYSSNYYTLSIKSFYLDSTGPEITINGNAWVFLDPGQKYKPDSATCKDLVFPDDTCEVTNDADIVSIDYTTDKHQLITYEAKDKLGNVSTAIVKIKVGMEEEKNNTLTIILISAGVLVVTGTILTFVLLKNHEKKKKMSYI